MPQQDPLANLGVAATPATAPQSSQATTDPLASLGVPASGQPITSNATIEAAPTANDIDSDLIAKTAAPDNILAQAGIRLTMPLVKKLVKIHDDIQDAENLSQGGRERHPVIAWLGDKAAAIEGLLTGQTNRPDEAIGTGKYGVLTNPVTGFILPSGEAPAAARVTEAAGPEAVDAVTQAARRVGSAAKGAAGYARDVMQGEAPAQAAFKATLENPWRGASAAADASGRGTLESAISDLMTKSRTTYNRIAEQLGGFNIKEAADESAKIERDMPNVSDPALKERMQARADALNQAIGAARRRLGSQQLAALQDADMQYTQASALQEMEKGVFKSPTRLRGNIAQGADESYNMKSTINFLQKMDDDTSYGRSRLAQALGGPDGEAKAQKLLTDLRAQQQAGETAISRQKLARTVGIYLLKTGGMGAAGGLGYEIYKHFVP